MLHQHKAICAPHPPHLLKTFHPLLHLYGPLSVSANFNRLINDMITWVKLNPVPWEAFNPTVQQIKDGSSSASVIQVFKSIYDWEARAEGKSVWVCKSMTNYEFVDAFEADGFIDKYIFLYRDGRDVALSFKKAIVGPKSPYFCAQQWAKDQLACLKLADNLGNKVILVRYEDLIEEPLQVLERLFTQLGLSMPADVLEFPKSEESIHTAEAGEMWKNVARPVIPTNKKKYLTLMSAGERQVYETVAGKPLSLLGYAVEFWNEGTPQDFTPEQLSAFQSDERLLRQEAVARTPQHDLDLRRGQDEFHSTLLKTLSSVG